MKLSLEGIFNAAQVPAPQILFKPSGTGKPPTTRGAGSRNNRRCPQDKLINPDAISKPLVLTPLIPPNQLGLTSSKHPTLWIYVPKTTAKQMVLSIKTEDAQPHTQQFLPVPNAAGIVGIQLTQTPPLEVGKMYQWAIVLVCGDRPSPNDPFVTAWVQHIPLTQTPREKSLLEQAAWFSEQGIWYDAFTALATVRRAQINDMDIAKVWADFLTQPSVGLSDFTDEPFQ